MSKRMLMMLVLVVLVFGGIFAFQAFKAHMIRKFMAAQGAPPQTVSTIKAGYQEWQPRLEAVGTLRAVRGTDIASEVSGIVAAITFQSGDDVKAGALLLQLRADDDLAKLQSLKATAELAETTYKRDQQQLKAQAVSQATIDNDVANLKSAKAQVAEQQALVDKKFIRAPFSGHLGIRAVDLGQYLNPGTKIVTLQALDPIYVDFYLPQKWFGHITIGQRVTAKADAYPGEAFGGEISAIDSKVDPNTRNVQVRATIHNPAHKLLPGMFATVDIATGEAQRYITLPQTAISYNPYGNTVFLIEQKGEQQAKPLLIARQRFVTTGDTRGDQVAILKGVAEGDTVVSAGQIKLRNGSPVLINNSIQPTDNPAPHLPPDQ
jgi:membrane fusion protein (multidrug efflux system)